jgi:hypothetical protein
MCQHEDSNAIVSLATTHPFVLELRHFVEYVTNNMDGLMDRARYNLFTQTYHADLVNLVHVVYVHDQLMMPDHIIDVPRFATEFKRLVKNRNPDWQKLLPTRINQALMPMMDAYHVYGHAPLLSDLASVSTDMSSMTGTAPSSAPAPATTPAQPGAVTPAIPIVPTSTCVVNSTPDKAFRPFGTMTGFSVCAVVDRFVNSKERGGMGFPCSALPSTDGGIELCLAYQIRLQCNTRCKRKATHRSLTAAERTRTVAWCTEHFKNPAK